MAGRVSNDGWFSMLPDELCLEILQYLSTRDKCRCMKVCRRLNALCNDASLWTQVRIRCKRLTSDLLHRMSSSWPHLQEMTLHNTPHGRQGNLSGGWAHFEHLESIVFRHCPPRVLGTLQDIIKCCPKLNRVNCSSMFFGKEHLLVLMTSGRSFTQLTLSHCPKIDDDAVDFVRQRSPTVFDHLSSLQVLNLKGLQYLTDRGILPILGACTTNLHSLDIHGYKQTDWTGLFIGQRLLGLKRLSIFNCSRLTDRSLLSFAGLKKLQSLELICGSCFTSKGLKTFLLQLAANKNSEPGTHPGLDSFMLTFFNDHVDSSLLVLGQNFPGLRVLNLQSCPKLTAAGIDALAQHCKSLVHLSVFYRECPHYKLILGTAFPQLKCLRLSSSDLLLDDEELQQLKKTRPCLEIRII